MERLGQEMHDFCRQLFPINRSLTGNGFRQSLAMIAAKLPEMIVHEVPSGTKCFDWTVPREWNIRDAWIETPQGDKICRFQDSNLHVVGYSVPVDQELDLAQLQEHLYSLPDQVDAIPYVTSYYRERWGFCLPHAQRQALVPGTYRVKIDSSLTPGVLNYGEWVLPGESSEEILLSSYLCHPSMANNELSGPVVGTYLAQWLRSLPKRRYSYRFVIVPETIGSIVFLSRSLSTLQERVRAGFVLTCLGDDRAVSFLPSRQGATLADQAARHVLKHMAPTHREYSYLERGSDERQYCSPGVNLPVCSIMRSKYGTFPEYHTSLDDLQFVTPEGLQGGFDLLRRTLECLELNQTYRAVLPCEPQLGPRGLYPDLSEKGSANGVRNMMNWLAYADGALSNLEIAERIGVPLWELGTFIPALVNAGVVEPV